MTFSAAEAADGRDMMDILAMHDAACGNAPDTDGRVAGCQEPIVNGTAQHRANTLLGENQACRALLALPPHQLEAVLQAMAAMWRDGFAVGAAFQARRARQSPSQ